MEKAVTKTRMKMDKAGRKCRGMQKLAALACSILCFGIFTLTFPNLTYAAATSLRITPTSSTITAGGSVELTIKAHNSNGTVDTAYSGNKSLTFSGLANSPNGNVPTVEGVNQGTAVTVAFTSGQSAANAATLIAYKAAVASVDVTDGTLNSTANAGYDIDLTVKHAAADHLKFASNSATPQTAGTSFALAALNAVDIYGNLADGANAATAYAGSKTVAYTLSGTANGPDSGTDTYTTAVSFTAGASTTTLTTTLYRVQSTTVTGNAADLAGTDVAGNSITVNVAAANKLKFTVNPPASVVVNNTWADFKIAIYDAYGNARGSGTNTITIAENGAGSFSGTLSQAAVAGEATFTGISHNTAESINVTGSATGLTATPAFAVSVLAVTTTVTSTADTNTAGTLRYALNNVLAGQTINFDATTFPSGTPATINVTSALPALTAGNVTIDATSRGVIVDGGGTVVDGFTVQSTGNTIKGLRIKSFTDDGIFVDTTGSVTIQNNTIYSNGDGIDFRSDSGTSVISGNYIGTDSAWTNLGNLNGIKVATTAILTIGGTTAADANYIMYHSSGSGIYVGDGSPKIIGNKIGANGSDATCRGNNYGINLVTGHDNVQIGGTNAGEGNIIGCGSTHIYISGIGAEVVTVQGNYIGTDTAWRDLGGNDHAIYKTNIGGTLTIGGATAAAANYICFSDTAGKAGIYVDNTAPTIQGNYIGTNSSGASLGNDIGIYLAAGADAVVIGGTNSGEGNVISRNTTDGIYNASTSTGITIPGRNRIGTDSAGTASWPNGGDGIESIAGTITLGPGFAPQKNIIGPNTGLGLNAPSGTPTFSFSGSGLTTLINDDVTFTAGTVTLGSAGLWLSGNWTAAAGITQNANTSSLTLAGTANQTITTGGKTLNSVTLNNTGAGGSDLVTIVGNLDIDGTLTLTNGVLTLTDASNPNVTIAGNLVIDNSADPGVTRGSGTWTFDGTTAATFTDSTAGLNLGTVTLNKTDTVAPATNNKLTLGSSITLTSITVDGTAGSPDTLALASAGYTLNLTGNGTPLTLNSGSTLDAGTNSTVKFIPAGTTGVNVAGATYHNVEFNKASNSFMLQGLLDVNGNLTITAGTLDADSNGVTAGGTIYNITVGGGWTNLGTFSGGTTGLVTFDGATTPVTLNPGSSVFCKLTIAKSAATNEVDVSTNSLAVLNDLNITTGTLDFSGTALNIRVTNHVTIGTDGRFSKGTGTFIFDTATTDTFTDNSSPGPQNLGTVQIGA